MPPANFNVNQPHLPNFGGDFSAELKAGRYMSFDRISVNPINLQYGTAGAPSGVSALPTAAVGGINTLLFPNGIGHRAIEMYQTTAQTLMPLVHDSKGLEIGLDQVNNESVEYVPGGNRSSNPLGYLAGTDPGVFIRATFELTTANGPDQFGVGFRKQEAYAVPVSFLTTGDPLYTDIVLLGIASAAATPANVSVSSDVGNSGSSLVTAANFTWASGLVHTLEVRLKGRKASYYINGARLGDRIAKDGLGNAITAQNTKGQPDYTVTSGLFMIPFFFARQDAGVSTIFLRKLACGRLSEDGLDPGNRTPAL